MGGSFAEFNFKATFQTCRTRPVEQGAGVPAHLEGIVSIWTCARRQFIAGVRELVRFGWTFDICIRHFQMESAIRLVDACPRFQFALDHIGKPNVKEPELEPWRSQMRQMALRDNVVCKLSGGLCQLIETEAERRQEETSLRTRTTEFG
ncbi:amidohydrolase family protein [Paraburkholderia youngii]|uniref:Amidohydrolase family protein n=1 Tax=Paraburkholderia youngii TaxID=2782701 RepID=A0ABX2NW89_9BURK|nr:amidohydrolase family protein [Paraburkholderia youngii]